MKKLLVLVALLTLGVVAFMVIINLTGEAE